ncbi:MAG: ribosome biogenesis GTP-binding protein YihA/YsxC [Bacteroidetes bacterium]|nr:ribosome biogenesis GTP-binding protein YihA/YsxC [Bacteroidota bacterium]
MNAKFLTSQTQVEKLTDPDKPEYAFIGRSNVGKSSLINMLMGNKKLAKVSASPGKTQTINHFEIDGTWYLVDLPGYGYAKTAKTDRASWKVMINDYLMLRDNLMCVFVLLDLRLPLQNNDLEFMNNLGENGIPFVIVYTKADKVGKVSFQKNIKVITKELLESWEELPQQFITSAETSIGQAEILKFIEETNRLF